MILRKKSQAGVFEETYTALLTAEDRQFPEQNETEQKRNPVLSEKQGIYPRLFQVHGLGHAWIK